MLSVRPPHLGIILPPKGGNYTLGHPWGGGSPPLIMRVKALHPWSPRRLKDPLYIRLYFLSLLLFFGSLLALGYQKEEERRSRPKEIIS